MTTWAHVLSDSLVQSLGDLRDRAHAIEAFVLALLLVVFLQRSGLLFVLHDTVADHRLVPVIGTTAAGTAPEQTPDEFLLRYFQGEHRRDRFLLHIQHRIQRF